MSATDPLTGLANRRRFDEALATETLRARRAGKPMALAMIDVDHFKKFNDLYGHQGGDDTLRQVAAVMAAHARRPSDLIARYGGEEIAMILPETPIDDALRILDAIRADIETRQLPHAGAPLGHVSVSIGIAALNAPLPDAAAVLIAAADQALYRAKDGGRNRVVVAGSAIAR